MTRSETTLIPRNPGPRWSAFSWSGDSGPHGRTFRSVAPLWTKNWYGTPYSIPGKVYHLRWKFSKTRWFSNISIRLTLKFSRLSVNQIVAKLAIQRFFIILTFKMPSSNYLPILTSTANGLFQWQSHDGTSNWYHIIWLICMTHKYVCLNEQYIQSVTACHNFDCSA